MEGVCLDELTATIETPFYLYSQKSIEDAYKKLKDSLNTKIIPEKFNIPKTIDLKLSCNEKIKNKGYIQEEF